MIAATNQPERPAVHGVLHRHLPDRRCPRTAASARACSSSSCRSRRRPVGRATGERHPQRHAPVVDVPVMDLPLDVEGVSTSAGGGASEALLRP